LLSGEFHTHVEECKLAPVKKAATSSNSDNSKKAATLSDSDESLQADSNDASTKRCIQCYNVLPLCEFLKKVSSASGLYYTRCAGCRDITTQKQKENNLKRKAAQEKKD
jgi:hypothetical protein